MYAQLFQFFYVGFPDWCDREKVPELYRKVQAMVTNNDMHPPDTNLLFPIFVSSGLPRELLGEIWELVNESGSGQLSVEEMYATLALIAVAQVCCYMQLKLLLNYFNKTSICELCYSIITTYVFII